MSQMWINLLDKIMFVYIYIDLAIVMYESDHKLLQENEEIINKTREFIRHYRRRTRNHQALGGIGG